MPEYEFFCPNENCSSKGATKIRTFRMNDEKKSTCENCKTPLVRKLLPFIDQYKGNGFSKSADAKEEVDAFKK